MNLVINTYNNTTFYAKKRVNITKEQILELRAAGVAERDIPSKLGISLATYYKKLNELNIPKKLETFQKELSKISKEEFEALLKAKVCIADICEKFKITNNAYYTLLEKFGLQSYILGASKKAVTKEKLLELINRNMSIPEICKELNISRDAYYELVKKFDIATPYRDSKRHIAEITKDTLSGLINSGRKNAEICEILDISLSTLQYLISKFNIKTKVGKNKEIYANITKEKIENLINSGKSVPEICKELNITPRMYTKFLSRFSIMTELKQSIANLRNISKEELQGLVDKGLTVEEICRQLNLSNPSMFYRLLKRLNISYNYMHHAGEIQIPQKELENVVENWTSKQDIEDVLKIHPATFYQKAKQANVTTIYGESINKINSINPEEIQTLLDDGVHWKKICEMYDIPLDIYPVLTRKYNLVSQAKRLFINAEKITKEKLEALLQAGKSKKEMCEELNVSFNTLIKKMRKFNLQ